MTDAEALILAILNIVTNFCMGAIVMTSCIVASVYSNTGFGSYYQYTSSFNHHIVLCVLGYILLMSQGVMVYSETNCWSKSLSIDGKQKAHWILQVLGSLLAIAGSIIRVRDLRSDYYHGNYGFGSTFHGTLGVLAVTLLVLTLILGIAKLIDRKDTKVIKMGHAAGGCATMFLAYLTLIFGMDKLIFRAYATSSGTNVLIIFSVIVFIGVMFSAISNLRKPGGRDEGSD